MDWSTRTAAMASGVARTAYANSLLVKSIPNGSDFSLNIVTYTIVRSASQREISVMSLRQCRCFAFCEATLRQVFWPRRFDPGWRAAAQGQPLLPLIALCDCLDLS